MRGTHVRIERLAVRMRGVPVHSARLAADGLGAEVARRLAEELGGGSTSLAVGHVRAGRVEAPRRAAPTELRAAVAGRIAETVSRTAAGKGR